MTGSVMGLVSHIRHKRITLLQAALMIRYVIGKKLEIGFRHAHIPKPRLKQWDQWLKDAVATRTDLSLPKLHKSSILPILKTLDLERTYVLEKTISIFENLIKPSDLQTRYINTLTATLAGTTPTSPDLSATLRLLQQHRISIVRNEKHRSSEPIHGTRAGLDHHFNQEPIPIRLGQYALWGKSFKQISPTTTVTICTDGSSNYRQPSNWSGASIVYLDDTFLADEYENTHQRWSVDTRMSYTAELAAINKAIRSVPVTVPIILYTDSLSSIQKIHTHRQNGGKSGPMACVARPYMRAIAAALDAREALGTTTRLLHVRSHTGSRDLQSIGNEAADRHAKLAFREQNWDQDMNLLPYELPFMVEILPKERDTTTHPDGGNKPPDLPKPIHDNIRKVLKTHLTASLIEDWAARPKRGELVREHRKGVLEIIDHVWRNPTSLKLTMLIDILNQADNPYSTPAQTPAPQCRRCGQQTHPNVTHRLLTCPAVADIWNDVEKQISTILDTHYTTADAVGTTQYRAKQIFDSHKLDALGRPPSTPRPPSDTTLRSISRMMACEETRRNTKQLHAELAQIMHQTQMVTLKSDLAILLTEANNALHATLTAAAECLTILSEAPARDTQGNILATMTHRHHLPLPCANLPIGTFIATVGTERRVTPDQAKRTKRQKTLHHVQTESCVQFEVITDTQTENQQKPSRPPIHHFIWWGVVVPPPPPDPRRPPPP
jgi:hypothetical protein